ncbi:hypothetical protein B0H10DRAFT_2438860 [Mycena sp. CBHHK59/15]|nr:hypothetical protein B0H10DRAFT_2438860 [Mycena sp. CBHHK59/15]
MADRDRRTASTAHPGDIVNKAKQRRRTREEIEREAASKQQAKEEKEKNAAEKKGRGVRRVAAMEEQMRDEDEHARGSAARPDLRTMELKRSIIARVQQQEHTPARDTSASPAPSSSADLDTPMYGVADSVDPFNDGDDSDKDPDYVVPDEEVNPSEEENDTDQEDAGQGDIDDDAEIEAKIAAYEKNLRAKAKAKGKAPTKPQKGALRAEIQEQQGLPSGTTKRKATEVAEPVEPAKKPKAAAGGLKANWQKDLGLDKPVKKSTTNWRRSMSSRASSASATSGISQPSTGSSTGDLPSGAFDQDEDESSMQAVRSAKRQGTATSATKKMGITLTKKTVNLFNPTYITINAAKFLDYEWIDITLPREYVSVLGASTTRSLPILDQVHVKIEAVPPSVSTVSVKAEPDVQHVASVKTRTLHVGEREVIELLSDSEPQTEDLDSDLEVIEALQPSRSSSVPPLSDADHSSKHDSDFEELDGGSDDENSDDLMLSDTVWLDDGTSQMISGRFRPSQKVTVERMEYRNGAAAVYPIHRVRTGIVVDLSDSKYHFRDASKALVPLTTVIMDADNDSWKWLGGSASTNLDAALRTAVRFELDDLAPRQAIVLAQQETRRTEGNTPEERVVLFINMIRKTKCNAIDSMGKPCRGGPILKPKPQGPSRGHELFVGCSGWTPKFQQGHRTHTISDNVNENLLARGLAGLPLADDLTLIS